MKKINKNDLRLDKEVISSLSGSELANINGGVNPTTIVIPSRTPTCKTMGAEMECIVSYDGRLSCHCVESVDLCIQSVGELSECICKYTDQC